MKLDEIISDAGMQALEAWKSAVREKHPDVETKLKFIGRVEKGVNTISAEVPGRDRSYGVFDIETEKGTVLD